MSVSALPTTAPGVAAEMARQAVAAHPDLILAAGGDGTINEVVNGMAGSRIPLGVLPGGTANVLATEIGLGSRMERVARQIQSCVPVRIALGRLYQGGNPPRYFLLMAGVGLDAHVVSQVRSGWKSILGKGEYWLAGFSQLGKTLTEFEVRANGQRFRAGFALASRVRNYGGDLELARNVNLMEPHFELVLFSGANPFVYLKYLAAAAVGQLERMNGVSVVRTRQAEFTSEEPVLIQVDGELIGPLPARVEIVPDALTLLAPPQFQQRVGVRAGQALAPA